jgi:hypothetical protein
MMWLKDLLPKDVNDIRIMSYGYNSNLVGETVDDRLHFIHMLENSRRSLKVYSLCYYVRRLSKLIWVISRMHRDQLYLSDMAQAAF